MSYTDEEKKAFNRRYYKTVERLEEYIESKRYLDNLINNWIHWITRRLDIVGGLQEMGGGGSIINDSQLRTLSTIDYLEQQIASKIDEANDKMLEIIELIDCVKNKNSRMVLRYRYLDDWDFQIISEAINYSYVHTKRLHRLGVYEIMKLIKNEPQ